MTDARVLPPLKVTTNINYCCQCETDMEEIKFGYIWTIKKFSQFQVATGKDISSSIFSASESDKNKWRLKLFPRSNIKGNEGYVSLFLNHDPKSLTTSAAFELSILNNSGEKARTKKISHEFTEKEFDWGFGQYIERDVLLDENNGLLNNDKLTILCEIFIQGELKNKDYNTVIDLDTCSSRLTEDLGHMLDSQDFSDVVLVAEGQEFPVHKALLAARSSVFSAMFRNDMSETRKNKVIISDISHNVVGELLRFIYTGKVPVMEEAMAMQLLTAADKYALEDLKTICEQELSVKVTSENVAQLIPLTNLHNASHLKARLVEFMKSHATDNIFNYLWNHVINEQPQFLAELFQAKE